MIQPRVSLRYLPSSAFANEIAIWQETLEHLGTLGVRRVKGKNYYVILGEEECLFPTVEAAAEELQERYERPAITRRHQSRLRRNGVLTEGEQRRAH